MMLLPVLPIIIPLASAALGVVAWRSLKAQRAIGLAGALSLLGAALLLFWHVSGGQIVVVQIASWPAPLGISLVADML
jgi:multicomponent Na+:H+ antiporter subunit D